MGGKFSLREIFLKLPARLHSLWRELALIMFSREVRCTNLMGVPANDVPRSVGANDRGEALFSGDEIMGYKKDR